MSLSSLPQEIFHQEIIPYLDEYALLKLSQITSEFDNYIMCLLSASDLDKDHDLLDVVLAQEKFRSKVSYKIPDKITFERCLRKKHYNILRYCSSGKGLMFLTSLSALDDANLRDVTIELRDLIVDNVSLITSMGSYTATRCLMKRIFRVTKDVPLMHELVLLTKDPEIHGYCYYRLLMKFDILTPYTMSLIPYRSDITPMELPQSSKEDFLMQIAIHGTVITRGKHLERNLLRLFEQPQGKTLLLLLLHSFSSQ